MALWVKPQEHAQKSAYFSLNSIETIGDSKKKLFMHHPNNAKQQQPPFLFAIHLIGFFHVRIAELSDKLIRPFIVRSAPPSSSEQYKGNFEGENV